MFWTTASRRPRMRLTSVDLPTFGRPTTASTGLTADSDTGTPSSVDATPRDATAHPTGHALASGSRSGLDRRIQRLGPVMRAYAIKPNDRTVRHIATNRPSVYEPVLSFTRPHSGAPRATPVSYTHLRAHETVLDL